MLFVYVLMAMTIALSITTVSFQNKGLLGVKFLLKALASFSFMAMGLAALALLEKVEPLHICIVAALLFGMLGDFFLSLRGIAKKEYVEPILLAGMLFFLIGHVIYIIVFLTLAKGFIVWLAAFLFVVPLGVYMLLKSGKISPDMPKPPILIYSLIIGAMFITALNFLLKARSAAAVVVFVGSILFMLSDLLLGFYNYGKFEKDSPKGNFIAFIYLPAYYVAQTLYVLSMVI
jgi:uncharacterized membrane protein YhhN